MCPNFHECLKGKHIQFLPQALTCPVPSSSKVVGAGNSHLRKTRSPSPRASEEREGPEVGQGRRVVLKVYGTPEILLLSCCFILCSFPSFPPAISAWCFLFWNGLSRTLQFNKGYDTGCSLLKDMIMDTDEEIHRARSEGPKH